MFFRHGTTFRPLCRRECGVGCLRPSTCHAGLNRNAELSLLARLALGGLTGAQLWHFLSVRAFGAVAAIYVLSTCLLLLGAVGSRGHGSAQAIFGFYTALKEPSLQRLAPVWLCVNTIVGLWLGPTLPFLLTRKGHGSQFLDGIFSNQPERIGWLLLGYSLIFGIGVTAWSVMLPRVTEQRALRIALLAMVGLFGRIFRQVLLRRRLSALTVEDDQDSE